MSCPVCRSKKLRLFASRMDRQGDRVKRFHCGVCFHRWNERNGVVEQRVDRWTEIDWRVTASEGCTTCVHCIKGFCSLGFPEARDPAFVTECEARLVVGGELVVQ